MEQSITLLDKAISYSKSISRLKSDPLVDELTLTTCAYLAQQELESTLKFILKFLNTQYKGMYHLVSLVNLIQTKLPIFCQPLKDNASIITSWKIESRYDINFKVTMDKIELAQTIFRLLLNEIEYSLYYYKSQEWDELYNKIKAQGFKYEEEIVQQMLAIYHNSGLTQPFETNIYTSLLQVYDDSKINTNKQTSLFDEV